MLNKKVALPWGLFSLTAMYVMMRPTCKVVHTKCHNSTESIRSPLQNMTEWVVYVDHQDQANLESQVQQVESHVDSHVQHVESHAHQVESHVHHVEYPHVHYVESHVQHHVRHVDANESHMRREHSDESRSTFFVMSVTLLTYLFIKVVVVPPRGYKKYI